MSNIQKIFIKNNLEQHTNETITLLLQSTFEIKHEEQEKNTTNKV